MSLQTPLYNTIYGTILATGTLSSEFNVQGYSLLGLQFLSSSVNGTLGFMVSDKDDAHSGVYRPLYAANGAPVAITVNSGQGAISSDALTPLKGYQFIRVSSTAQTLGASIMLSLKTE
jgi:hypothetical protein